MSQPQDELAPRRRTKQLRQNIIEAALELRDLIKKYRDKTLLLSELPAGIEKLEQASAAWMREAAPYESSSAVEQVTNVLLKCNIVLATIVSEASSKKETP